MKNDCEAIGMLVAECALELNRTPHDQHALLHDIARELESLADVLEMKIKSRRNPSRSGIVRAYQRALELPLARTIRAVLCNQLARLQSSKHAVARSYMRGA